MPFINKITLIIILNNIYTQYNLKYILFLKPALITLLLKYILEANFRNFITKVKHILTVVTLEKQDIRAEDYNIVIKKI